MHGDAQGAPLPLLWISAQHQGRRRGCHGDRMSDQIEAMGALATAAQALDQPGPGPAGHGHGGTCANCAAPLAGPFCAQCGQRAHLHHSMAEVFHDFLHGITHIDGKAWKTLPMLLFQPGRLTRSYIDGQRARYIAPVPLFLMVVFLMFFALSFVHLPDDAVVANAGNLTPTQREAELKRSIADIDKDIAAAQAAGRSDEVARLKTARAGLVAVGNGVRDGKGSAAVLGEAGRELSKAAAENELDINSGWPWLDDHVREAAKNPSLLLYKLQAKAYKLSFLLVPLSLPWLWLVFVWRRGVGMYEHAVFTLYSISFMSLLFIAGSLALTAGVTAGLFWQLLLLAPAAHMFVQLRGAYGLGWWGAGWRTVYLSLAACISLSLYLVLMLVIGLLD